MQSILLMTDQEDYQVKYEEWEVGFESQRNPRVPGLSAMTDVHKGKDHDEVSPRGFRADGSSGVEH